MWDHLTHEETQELGLTKPPYSYRVVGFTMCDHSGTHVDAINHLFGIRGWTNPVTLYRQHANRLKNKGV